MQRRGLRPTLVELNRAMLSAYIAVCCCGDYVGFLQGCVCLLSLTLNLLSFTSFLQTEMTSLLPLRHFCRLRPAQRRVSA